MAIRLFGPRQPKDQHQDPTRLASAGKPARTITVVRSDVKKDEPAIVDTVVNESGSDPYNSTGRFLAEKIRQRRYD